MITTKTRTHRISTSKNAEIEIVVQKRGEYPVFVEPINPDIVRIPLGESIFDSVFVKREYAKGSQYEEPKGMKFFRRGRTLSIVLDEPIKYNGEEHWVIEVKGTGADTTTRKMLIGFDYDRSLSLKYIESNSVWGGVIFEDAIDEIENARRLIEIGIPMTPHIKANKIPEQTLEAIKNEEMSLKIIGLGQVVRIAKTNIRPNDLLRCRIKELIGEREINEMVKTDIQIDQVGEELRGGNRRLVFEGSTQDNRYLDGILTDAENIQLVSNARDNERMIDIAKETKSWLYELDPKLEQMYMERYRGSAK